MEKLTALCCLWIAGFCEKTDYERELDEMFLKDPENDTLLELEGLYGDKQGTLSMLARQINDANEDEFGRELLVHLERYYGETENIMSFGRLADKLRETLIFVLPYRSVNSEPYYSLDLAVEELDPGWGDEQRARECFRLAFDYYKE